MITYCQIKTIRPISSIRIDPMKKKILKAFFFSADNNILQKYAHRVRHFLATTGFKVETWTLQKHPYILINWLIFLVVLSEPRVVWILSVKCRAWPWVICQQCGIVSHMRSKIIFNIISTTRDQTNKNRENLLDGYRWLEMIADVFISNFWSRLTSQLVKINIALHSIIVSTDKSEKLKWWIGTWIISWFLQNFNFFFLYRIVKLFNLTPRKRLLLYSYCKIWIYTVGVNTKFYPPSKFKIYISTIPEVLVILRDGIHSFEEEKIM